MRTQYVPEFSSWIINMNTKEAKAKALAGRFCHSKRKHSNWRIVNIVKKQNKPLSIHDIQMNVSDEYIITEWVDSFAKQESDVMKHIAKPKSNESTEK